MAENASGVWEAEVDSIYLGGGTPTVLEPQQLERMFANVRKHFHVLPDAEVTIECAPGTLDAERLETLQRCGANRISLGVQSFVDQEARAVGRLHTRAKILEDLQRLRSAGIANINIDLIAGLPHQTAESWEFSLSETLATEAPHASVYMLEVDEDSRLGKELIAGGTRYHAHFVPSDDLTADLYETACERLNAAGVARYEISNFARSGNESRHNLKYWTRQPYLGFGVDAHSMMRSARSDLDAVRIATPDSLDRYTSGDAASVSEISAQAALEEEFFLGLRLNRGVSLQALSAKYGDDPIQNLQPTVNRLIDARLLEQSNAKLRLTARGRLLSNEVFQQFLGSEKIEETPVQ
jgi:oxygen-independent coproporphyrinogen-3 oxidase